MVKLRQFRYWPGRMAQLPMGKKLIVIFIFLIIVPVSAASIVSFHYYARSLTGKATDYTARLGANLIDKLDDYMTDMDRISIMPLYLTDLQYSLENGRNSLDSQRQIDYNIEIMNHLKQGTHSVYIFDKQGRVHYNIKSSALREDLDGQYAKWLQVAREAEGKSVLISPEAVDLHTPMPSFIFTLVREIKNIYTSETVGLIAVDVRIDIIESAVHELDELTKGRTLIVDDHNRVVYDSGRELIASDLSGLSDLRLAQGASGDFRTMQDGKQQLVSYTTSENTGWKVLIYVPLETLTQDVRVVRNITVGITLAIMIFALIVAVVFSYAITRPLKRLAGAMKKAQMGQLDVRFAGNSRDEIGIVGNQFNQMLETIGELIQENYIMAYRKKTAELEALQSQINPHFIYNTLETIRMTAETSHDFEAAEMLVVLGNLLRYSVNRGNESVTLRQELEHLERYICIQNFRFPDKYKLIADIDPPLLDYRLIKLLLQPIVENSIVHGMEGVRRGCEIRLIARAEEDGVVVAIADNGVGLDDVGLTKLRKSLEEPGGMTDEKPQIGRGGIGLKNVHERVRLHYGDGYGLRISSTPGIETIVELRLPPEGVEETGQAGITQPGGGAIA